MAPKWSSFRYLTYSRPRHPGLACVLAVAASSAAYLLIWALQGGHPRVPLYPFFTLAVITSALYGGFWPGIIAVALSVLYSVHFILRPQFWFLVGERSTLLSLAAFGVVGVSVSLLASILRSNRHALQQRNADLHRERERWRGVVEGIAEEVWVCNVKGEMSLKNLSKITAMGLEAFQNKTIHEVLEEVDILLLDGTPRPPEQAPLYRSMRGEILRGEEIMRHRRTGRIRYRQFSSAPTRDAEGNITGAVAIVRDVTETKEAEQALRDSEARFRATVENIPQMVWVADARGNFRYLSPKWLDYTGTTELDNANGGWTNAIHPEDRTRSAERWAMAVATHGTYEAEYRLRRSDGEYRWQFARAVPIPESHDGAPLWFGTTTDIDDNKRTQELLIRSEKVAALGRMAATLAHDINNPLAAAMNTVFLAKASTTTESLKTFLDTAEEELKRIAQITGRALGFYRDNSGPAPVAVEDVVDEAVDLLRSRIKAKHLKVETQYEEGSDVIGISGELRQVFCNLIANSVDALAENGTLRLRVFRTRHPRTGTPCVWITVADNGKGIEPGSRKRIFEPLFTTKGSLGTGLGLWVTNQLIEKHGGSIRVRSSVNRVRRGTTFAVLLPGQAGSARPAVAAAGAGNQL